MWWFHRAVYLRLLLVLLPCTLWHVWFHANFILLRLHGLHLLRLLPHARNCRVPRSSPFRSPHIPVYQVWVNRWHIFSLVPISCFCELGLGPATFFVTKFMMSNRTSLYSYGLLFVSISPTDELFLRAFFWKKWQPCCYVVWRVMGASWILIFVT